MSFKKLAIDEIAGGLGGKRVIARVDFNVPISKKDGVSITNTQRIDAAIPTIACASVAARAAAARLAAPPAAALAPSEAASAPRRPPSLPRCQTRSRAAPRASCSCRTWGAPTAMPTPSSR